MRRVTSLAARAATIPLERAPQVVARICDAWLALHDHYRGLLRAPVGEGVPQ